MSLLPNLIFQISWMPVSLMVELETRDLLQVSLRDDDHEIAKALVGLCHKSDTLIQESEAFGVDFLVDKMEATDGELPSCLQACGAIESPKSISASDTLLWRVLSLTDRDF